MPSPVCSKPNTEVVLCTKSTHILYVFPHPQVYVLLEYKLSNVYQVKLDHLAHFPNISSLWNALVILIALPVVNFVVLPFIPSWTMRERMGIGVALIALSAILAAYLEWCVFPLVSQHHQFMWLLLPIVTVSLGEMLLFVTGK